ncbi:hypothetical protein B0H19DRAFT_1276188 [Mycena capillaripes]|nr:hypothetical protein B0H19DRAFT_1276188 [Mycena capillaripes]
MASATPTPTTFDASAASSIALSISAGSASPPDSSRTPGSSIQTSSISQTSSTSSGSSITATSLAPSTPTHKNAVPMGAIVGIVVAICSIIFLGIVLIWLKRRRRQRPQDEFPETTATPYPVFFPDIASAIPNSADSSDARSISKVRRQYLTNELLAAQEKITHIQNLERRTSSTRGAGRIMRLLSDRRTSRNESSATSELRERNQMLMTQIRELQAEMESPWALGLSDEPPPSYS